MPPPQRERIKQKFIAGKSIVEIAHEENRNRETVGNIVHGPDMQMRMQQMREQTAGLFVDAFNAVKKSLEKQCDGRLGLQLLTSLGAFPSPEERRLVIPPPKTDEATAIKNIALRMVEGAIERHRFFEMPFPEAELHLRQLQEEAIREETLRQMVKNGPPRKKPKKKNGELNSD